MKITTSLKYIIVTCLITIIGILAIGLPSQASAATPSIERSMYIWSATQTTYGANYIKKYLIKNNISTAIVSLASTNKTVFKKLLTDLPKKGIRFEILIGNNSLLTNPDPEAFYDALFAGIDISNIAAIHLDIEPHSSAFPDFDERRDYYFDLYTELLETTKTYAEQRGMELSVSIPVFYPTDTLTEIYALADMVYLMAYEIQSMDYLERRVSEEMELGAEKTVIALRANDFTKRSTFETYLKNASTKLGTYSFAMHDLRRFIELGTR